MSKLSFSYHLIHVVPDKGLLLLICSTMHQSHSLMFYTKKKNLAEFSHSETQQKKKRRYLVPPKR